MQHEIEMGAQHRANNLQMSPEEKKNVKDTLHNAHANPNDPEAKKKLAELIARSEKNPHLKKQIAELRKDVKKFDQVAQVADGQRAVVDTQKAVVDTQNEKKGARAAAIDSSANELFDSMVSSAPTKKTTPEGEKSTTRDATNKPVKMATKPPNPSV